MASAHELRGRYASWSSAYDRDTARFGWCAPAYVLDALAEYQPPASHHRVLDLGVGTGQATRPYLELGAAVTGLDLAPEMLAQARAANGPASYFRLLQHDLNVPLAQLGFSHPFDTVVGVGVLHFVSNLERLITDVAGLLAPGGHFAFSYIAPQRREFSSATLVRPEAEIVEMVARSGLTLLEHRPFVAYYDQGDQSDPVEYRLVVLRDPRSTPEPPSILVELDKTACIDRERVLRIAAEPALAITPTTCNPQSIEAEQRNPQTCRETDVLVVLAHPDDESIYMGGTLARLTDSGFHVELLTLTDGAGGRRAGAATQDSLAQRRANELQAAAGVLGLRSVELGGFEDFGKTSDALRERPYTQRDALDHWGDAVVERIAAAIESRRPRVVLTFHPEHDPNFSLHAHHLACGEACRQAMTRAQHPPRRLLAVVHPSKARAERRTPSDAWGHVSLSGRALGIKRRAISAHASQRFSSARLLEKLERVETHVEGWVVLAEAGGLPPDDDPLRALFGSPGWVEHRTFPPGSPLPRLHAGDVEVLACYDPPRAAAVTQRRVCTGQQVGLAGGPGLVLAKALGALELGDGRAQFWMASQDHDWQEIATASVWTPGGRVRSRWHVPTEMIGRPVGDTKLGPEIQDTVDDLADALDGPFSSEARAALRSHYRPGVGPEQAFAGLCSSLWPTPGLEFIAPHRAEHCEAAGALVRRLLRDPRGALEAVQAGCNALHELDVTPPVDGTSFPLFFHDAHGQRQRIAHLGVAPGGSGHAGGRFAVGGVEMTQQQLEDVLDAQPERFSPDVLLRPAWQDAVFGITDYVAGPTEFAYWGQAYALHRFLGVEGARVWLRPTFRVTRRRTTRAPAELRERARALDALAQTLMQDGPLQETGIAPAQIIRALADTGDERLDRTLAWARRDLEPLAAEACTSTGRARGRTIRVLHRASKAVDQACRRREGPQDPCDRANQDRCVWWLQLYAQHGPELILQLQETLARVGPERWSRLELRLERGEA